MSAVLKLQEALLSSDELIHAMDKELRNGGAFDMGNWSIEFCKNFVPYASGQERECFVLTVFLNGKCIETPHWELIDALREAFKGRV